MAVHRIVLLASLMTMIAACSTARPASLVDGGPAFMDTTYGAHSSMTTPNGPM
jgi:hypothetical protein